MLSEKLLESETIITTFKNQTLLGINMIKNTTATVDAVGQLNITGDVIPPSWFKHVLYKTETGVVKPDLLAIYILANIRYWYTPTIKRDEASDSIISISKKFESDKLQKNYDSYAKLTGHSKWQVKKSFDLLKNLGLLTIEFRNIIVRDVKLYNVMYVEPCSERIKEITYNNESNTEIHPPSHKNLHHPPQKFTPPPIEKWDTYTKNTTKNTTERIFKEEKCNELCSLLNSPLETSSEKKKESKENTIDISPTFSRVDEYCNNTFKTEATKILEFLHGMENSKNTNMIYKFITYIVDIYEPQRLIQFIEKFTDKLKMGVVETYNANYVLEFFKREDIKIMKHGKDIGDFKEFCIDTFGEELGKKVAHFYRYVLTSRKDDGVDMPNLTERRINNIKTIIELYGRELFFRCMNRLLDDHTAGILKSNSMRYFINYVKSVAKGSIKKQSSSLFPTLEENKVIIPIPLRKVGNHAYKDQSCNWMFSCECGGEFDRWAERCPACGNIPDWGELRMAKYEKEYAKSDNTKSDGNGSVESI